MPNVAKRIDVLHQQCASVWVPRWFTAFSDPRGGFYERLDRDFQPLTLPKRLHPQCRQIMVYSQHCATNPDADMRDKCLSSFAYLIEKFRNEKTGGFHFSINADGNVADATYDLYGLAFVILACSAYYKTFKHDRALTVARDTLSFIDKNFRLPGAPGLAEALDGALHPIKTTRRQNPHMHLTEACIFMHDACGDPAYLAMATEMLGIFQNYLYDPKLNAIREFFGDHLQPHATEGNLIEAGHHSEWVWLLSRYQKTCGCPNPALTEIMIKLFNRVATSGFDRQHGGIYNAQKIDGTPADTQKRIWPVLETLRAAAIMMTNAAYAETAEQVADQCLSLINLYIASDGRWVEMMSQGVKPILDYLPASTPYHIALPLAEVAAIIGA